MEDTNGILYSSFRSHTLDGLDYNLLSLLVGIQFSIIHDFIDITCSIQFSLIFQTFHQSLFRFLSTQTREFLQFSLLHLLHLLEFLLLDCEEFFLIVNTLLILLHFLFATTQFFLALIERNLTLLKLVFTLLDTGITLLYFLLQLSLLIQEFFLYLKKFFLFNYLSLFIGCFYHFIIFSLNNITENEKPCSST